MARHVRVVLGKVGLDGHDRGAKVIARGLRDAGMEVIYSGIRRTPAELAQIVLQEDADVLGLSMLSGGVVAQTGDVMDQLRILGLEDVMVFVGGIVSGAVAEELAALGVRGVYGPGSSLADIAAAIERNVDARGTGSHFPVSR
jgi:methylmalonyl-CoA mutase, C-terminal domain